MYKKTLMFLVILALFLAGCAGQTGTPSTAPAATRAPSGTQAEAVAAQCRVSSNSLPEASEKDWSQGPENARYTLIEYGDFQ